MNQACLDILETMQPVSLSEMDSVSLMNRVDTKYVLNETDLVKLLDNVQQHYRVLTIEKRRYTPYSSIYFDSPDYDCYLQHHNGKLNRRKFRMREYQSTGVCFFEIKYKNNKGRTIKRRIQIPTLQETLPTETTDFLQSQMKTPPILLARLWTSFSRITLVDVNDHERATIDCDLEFRFGNQRESLPGVVIAEVKQAEDSRDSVMREQLHQQHVRPLRVSKYCLGMMLLNPQLKSNRFKSKLLAIRKIA